MPFEAKTPRVGSGRTVTDSVRIRPAEGFNLTIERDRGWGHTGTPGDPFSYRTTNSAFPPIRVALASAQRHLLPSELGWLNPVSRPKPTIEKQPVTTPDQPAISPKGSAPVVHESVESGPRWLRPVSGAMGWGATVLLVMLLVARFPYAFWPEQLGLVAGLLGVALGHGWWIGLPLWLVARVVWVLEFLGRGLRSRA